jgi:hypothetical protein
MNLSKIMIYILALIVLVGQAQAASIALSPSSKTVNPGQTFILNVSIDPLGAAISGAQLNLAYNKSIIRVNGITEGNLFKQNGTSTFFNSGAINNSIGTVENIFGVILGHYNISTSGTFISINITAINQSGSTGINLSHIIISSTEGTAVPLNIANGSVLINSPPVLSLIDNKTVNEGQNISFTIVASDANEDILTYTASNLPSGATFYPANATFNWTPGFTQSGIYPNIHFVVTDGNLTDSRNITITVNNVNRAPTFTAIPANGSVFNETDTIIIRTTANDLDNDTLSYIIQIDGIQVGTSPDYNWSTNYSSSGSHIINISVTDGTALVSQTIAVQINNAYPRYDVNENGEVEIGDIVLIGQHFNEAFPLPYPRYDVNMDSVVNIMDIVIAGQHFGEKT